MKLLAVICLALPACRGYTVSLSFGYKEMTTGINWTAPPLPAGDGSGKTPVLVNPAE